MRVNVILHPYYWARRKIPLLAVMVGSNSDRLEMAILTNIMYHGHGHDTREVLFVTSRVHRRFCMSNRLTLGNKIEWPPKKWKSMYK